MKTIEIKNVGPMKEVNIALGDLTVLVGPQATGKTVALQFIRLGFDRTFICQKFRENGFHWRNDWKEFLSIYLGEGMSSVWNNNSRINYDGKEFETKSLGKGRGSQRKSFFVPAHRSAVFENGWPRSFQQFDSSTPFAIRDFSDNIRASMLNKKDSGIFPKNNKLKLRIRNEISKSIFRKAELSLQVIGNNRKFVLKIPGGGDISVGSWSAGQREFTPLLLGIYDLLPSSRVATKEGIETVIIEEPEMGLHPSAIYTVMSLALELISRNYKVLISTHSPAVLDIVWALHEIKTKKGNESLLLKILGLSSKAKPSLAFAKKCLSKAYKVYYFRPTNEGVVSKDISELDPSHQDSSQSGWGGLTEFSGRTADVVGSLYEGQE